MLRCPLTSVVLELLAMDVTDLLTFDYISPPSEEGLVSALEQLCVLECIERDGDDGRIRLTRLGRIISYFPLEPCLARAIVLAAHVSHSIIPPSSSLS